MDPHAHPHARRTGVLEVDHHGVIVHADLRAHELLGAGLVGRYIDDLAPHGHARHRAAFARDPFARSMAGRVVEAQRTDGARAHVHIGLLPLSHGRVAVAVQSHEDGIVDKLEKSLDCLNGEIGVLTDASQAMEIFELMVERIPVAMAVGDAHGWICVSHRLASCLGWDRHAMSKQRYEDLIHPADLGATAEIAARVIAAGEPGRITNRYRVHGTDRWRRIAWHWDPPGASGLTLAIAEDLGEAE